MNEGQDSAPCSTVAINVGRLKHLEIIQATISRMAGNSLLVKGWSATLISAILALAVKDRAFTMVGVAFVPCLMFWVLDGYFLQQERLFRRLWDAKRAECQDLATDFSMDSTPFRAKVATWPRTVF